MNDAKQPRIALITGAAQGIGLAIATRLAEAGMSLVMTDVHGQNVRRAADALAAAGHTVLAQVLDVSSEASVGEVLGFIDERFGRLDVLVNNAGISGVRRPVADMTLAEWEGLLRINLTGTFLVSRAAIPLMKRHRWGRIVNVASQAARTRTGVGKAQYAASKAGVLGLARVLADEVGRDGITVNSVCPSRTVTALTQANAAGDPEYFRGAIAQTAVGRLAEPSDTAAAVAFLCSDEAAFITGSVIDVTGGTFMP